jgi:hypothetical protein
MVIASERPQMKDNGSDPVALKLEDLSEVSSAGDDAGAAVSSIVFSVVDTSHPPSVYVWTLLGMQCKLEKKEIR